MKCTITDRGRLINLKQASYKEAILELHSNIITQYQMPELYIAEYYTIYMLYILYAILLCI